jgi:PAS domain S-box-containing protein
MNPVLYIDIFSAILNGFIGFYVYLLNPKKITNKVFAVLVLLFAIFSIGEFIARASETKDLALIGGRICYSILPLASCLGVHFSLVFPRRYPNDQNIFFRYKYSLIFLYIVSIIIIIIFNILISIQDVQISEWGYVVVLNSSTAFLIYWLLFCTLYATASLMHTYFKKNITIAEKKQIEFVTVGFILVVTLSLGSNLLPPLFDILVFPMTSVSLTLFSFLVAFSMMKYKLMAIATVETSDIIVNTMTDSLIVLNENATIVKVNKSVLDLLDYSEKDLVGASLDQIIKLFGQEKRKAKEFLQSKFFKTLLAANKTEDTEIEFVTKNGRFIPMNISASMIYGKNKNIEGIVIVARDLTETKKLIHDLKETKNKLEDMVEERTKELIKANEELQTEIKERKKAEERIGISLKEKEALLREIHHRVKNNLQVISSLLDLQTGRLKDESSLDAFKESQNRVKSMSLIHEQLYQSQNLTKIDFDKYIKNLTINLLYLYGDNPDKISIKINARDVFLNIDKAIPCGLMINELVSNSLKHGFPGGKQGEIFINFRLDNDKRYTLTVNDNGIGFPEKFILQNTESLGLQLVNMLTQQLKGTIELDRNHGTTFTIKFPGPGLKMKR